MNILVGSKNPVKIESVREAFSNYFNSIEVNGREVDSKVSAQPINNETFTGAKNRANELVMLAQKEDLSIDYFVGIEGGIIEEHYQWFAFGCICIVNNTGQISFGTSSLFPLPSIIVTELLNGKELGEVIDKIADDENTKQKGGAIGFLTNGIITRKELYKQGIISALVPFLHPALYSK
ncbi:MAG: inosine/xanthosine triphosphatase [Ignavibacteriaceae bacterium]|nr:inosine/xanthosine triphosphatase [Ignavibacteriaceae bacterium]